MMLENMLDNLRIALYVLLATMGFFLYQAWVADHPVAQELTATQPKLVESRFVPEAASAQEAAEVKPQQALVPAPTPSAGQLVNVTTDVLALTLNTQGGDILGVKLLQYPESLNSKTPFILLNNEPATRYIAESGLVGQQGPDTKAGQAVYTAEQTDYSLSPGQNELKVRLVWHGDNGLTVTKVYTFQRQSYEVKVGYEINNQSTQPWVGSLYTQLARTNNPPPTHSGIVNLATYFGGAISTPQKPFQKLSFSDMKEKNLDQPVKGGWAAMIQHYFISAWVPPKDMVADYYTRASSNGLYTLGMITQPITVQPGASAYTEAKLYSGPAIADQLEKTTPGLKLTIDYGWFWFISDIIFWMMQQIYNFVGNWGWAIVIVTIIIKLLFYQLSAKSYRSMSGLKRLQPKMEALKERYKDDRQKMTQATLELYRQEKVNPMSGCLPILIQIPVFIALYWVLVESVQLRQAPFIFWIHDLSQQDPYYILPVLMGISMFIQQRLNPPPPDPMQAKVMMLMPVIFTVLFANFPAGLMLYWFVNNTLSFLQQWYIMKRVEKEANAKR